MGKVRWRKATQQPLVNVADLSPTFCHDTPLPTLGLLPGGQGWQIDLVTGTGPSPQGPGWIVLPPETGGWGCSCSPQRGALQRPLPAAVPQAGEPSPRSASRARRPSRATTWGFLGRSLVAPPQPPYERVCQAGHPVLRGAAAAVDPALLAGPELRRLIHTLVRVMRRLPSQGLSAPQLGVPLQVFVAELPERLHRETSPGLREARQMAPFPLKVFVNPAMRVLDSRLVSFPEGCASVAGFAASVPRYQAVEVSGLNEAGDPVSWQASGWAARILQHEMDHLQGILYIDKMESQTFVNTRWTEVTE
uniref:Peptide deformylase n=1 Tax=Chrysemys picta bellii TaxID=8478 RepID=A0A8C3IV64_CHRPI